MSNYYERESQYGGAPPQQTYSTYDNNYSTYQPPHDNSYRQQDMAVTQYNSDYSRDRAGSRYEDSRYDDRSRNRSNSRGRDYDDRRSDYDDRRYSRERSGGSRRGSRGVSIDREESREYESERGGPRGDHHKGKEIGAGALGAAVGGFAGHEFGHNKLATTIGALAGAWGGYELEKRHEKKKERRESQRYEDYSSDSRRSLSRGSRGSRRSQSGKRSEFEDVDYQRRYDERSRY